MLNRLADRVRLRADVDNLSMLAPIQGIQRAFAIGEELRGHINALQPDGIAKVIIDGRPFLLRLPFNANPGDWVHLTVSAREPKLRFELTAYPASATSPTQLSDAARFITALLAEADRLPVASPVISAAPLLPAAPATTPPLGRALARALAESGLFYESHLAQWAAGTRTLEALKNEPQSRLPAFGTSQAVTPAGKEDTEATAGAAELPVHRDALAIVRQQLETLTTRQLHWHGTIWPDQILRWQIGEYPAGGSATAGEPQWQTQIRLHLPTLGYITATLCMDNTSAAIQIQAEEPDAVAALTAHRADLVNLLQALGVPAPRIAIAGDADA